MSHREVIQRALADRLAQFEGSRISERPAERQKFLRETTTMVLIMLEHGMEHLPVPETTNFPLVQFHHHDDGLTAFDEPFPLPIPRCGECGSQTGCVHHD